jgi:tetratricopeptide (TPR) repeat protein
VEFDYWLQVQREALLQRAISMLDKLVAWHLGQGQREIAIRHVRRKIELVPWIEPNYCQLMELMAENGHFGQAWQTFIDCQRYLQREMGLEPEARTVEIAHRLRREHAATPPSSTSPPIQRSPLTIIACRLLPQEKASVDELFSELAAAAGSAREVVHKHNGYFVALHANLLLAYFGFPKSREQAPREAIEAAFELRHTLSGFSRLDCRQAIHRGLGLLDERFTLPDANGELSQRTTVMLDSVGSNEIHVSPGLFEQISVHFSGTKCSDTAVSIIDRRNKHRHLHKGRSNQQPLIGRRHEMHQLISFWKEAESQGTLIAQVTGDPGIGKSKLTQALARHVRTSGGRIGKLHCLPEEQHTPYYPLSDALARILGDDTNLPAEIRQNKIGQKIARNKLLLPHKDVIFRLLGLPSALDAIGDQRLLKQQTENSLGRLLGAMSTTKPVLLLVEDLHWSDEETLGFLRRLARDRLQGQHQPLLIITTSRHEESISEYTPCIALSPLSDVETVELVRSMGQDSLGETNVEAIARRSDGIPLYAEQLLYALRQGMAHDGMPETLHDLLAARIGAQGIHRKLAQHAAIIGREFDIQLLSALWDDSDEALQAGLAALRNNGLIKNEQANVAAFCHALIREAAFQSIPLQERRGIQLRLVRVLRSQFAEWVKQRPELIATHLHDAEDPGAALAWLEAGRKAAASSLQQQATHFFRRGLEAIHFLSDANHRNDKEFHLLVGLGTALLAVLGYGNRESRQVFARAQELSQLLGGSMEIIQALWGLWLGGRSLGSSDHPLALANLLAHAARDLDDPSIRLQVNYAYGNNYFWLARYEEARKHLNIAIEQSERADNHDLIARFGENSGIPARSFLAWIEWIEGRPDLAVHQANSAIEIARKTGHAHTLAFALTFAAVLHRHLRQPHEAGIYLEELSTLAEANDLMLWRAAAAAVHGWVRCALGDDGGLELIRQAVEAAHEAMSAVEATFLSFWAEALFMLKRFDEALTLVEHSLEMVHHLQDNYLIPVFLRIKGDSLLALHPDNADEGLALIEESLACAEAQGAHTLALRAAASLVRHTTSPGYLKKLENCLDFCRDTGDFPDFSEARALFAQASQS